MITELHLENWKSFGKATLYIDPLTILIGTNASGKSNVLDALRFLHYIGLGYTPTMALDFIRGGDEWVVKRPNRECELSLVIITNKEYSAHFSYNLDKKTIYGRYEVASDSGETEKLIDGVLQSILILNPNPTMMRQYTSLATRMQEDASNIAGVLAGLPSERQKAVEDTLTYYASRLPESEIVRVYAEKVGKLGKDAMLYCDEKLGKNDEIFTVDARAMSDGTLRFLAILTALLTLPEGSLLAIDEVDNGLHPSRASLLLEALKSIGKERHIDVLVTTHNPALLDALGTEFVPFVTVAHRDPVSGESKLTLLEDIAQLPKLLAQGTVGKLATQGLIEQALESAHE